MLLNVPVHESGGLSLDLQVLAELEAQLLFTLLVWYRVAMIKQDINGGLSVSFEEGVYLMAAAMITEARRAAALGDREAAAFLEDWRDHFGQRRKPAPRKAPFSAKDLVP